jgi:uncharacterized protein YigE (DUF2233 family)
MRILLVKYLRLLMFAFMLTALATGLYAFTVSNSQDDSRFITYVVNPATQNLQLYYKMISSKTLAALAALKTGSKKSTLH